MTTTDEPAQPQNKRRYPTLLKRISPVVLLFGVAAFVYWFVDAERSLTGRPTMDMLLVWGGLNLLFYLWVRGYSGFGKKTQFRWIGGFVAVQAALVATVQLEGVYGNGRPVFNWRWAKKPADQFVGSDESGKQNLGLPAVAAWPGFRGANRDGVSSFAVEEWNEHPPRQLWRQTIGAGWSSFAVSGEYCFTMEQRGGRECTVCYALSTGEQIWVHADKERFSEITGGEGPRATPSIQGNRLFAQGATGILNCLDARNGELIWTVDILKKYDALNCLYGVCTSPLLSDDNVIVCVGSPRASLVAFDQQTGDVVWEAGFTDASYSSPQKMTLCGVPQVLIFDAEGLFSYDLANGKPLWGVPWISNEEERNNVCQPIQVSEDQVFISSGYGQGSALFQLENSGGAFGVEMVWANKNLKSKFASAVFDGQFVYGLDEGILVCLDIKTGERMWKNGRYAHGQLVKSGDWLIVQAENGDLAQVAADPIKFQEAKRMRALNRRTWTHPVVSNGYLITRNDREIICYTVVGN